MKRYGTPFFKTKNHAIGYYKEYLCFRSIDEIIDNVEYKIKNKEIFIGKPGLNEGEKLYIDEYGRYHIEKD